MTNQNEKQQDFKQQDSKKLSSKKLGWSDEEIELMISRVLDERREVEVPGSFAARVCGSLPAKPDVRRRMSVRTSVAMVMAVLVLGAMFFLASRAPMNFRSLAFDVECVFMVQLAAIMYWLAVRRES
jgi:hypothetical protein